jgi:hypothetical protein
MGFVAMSGSPWSLTVVPAELDFDVSYCTGTGAGIAHHGLPADVEGNLVEFHARDQFDNPRLTGTDVLAINFLSSSAEIDEVVAGEDGVYSFSYWWQYASYEQHIVFCPVDGLDAWATSTSECFDTSTVCAEEPGTLIDVLSTTPEAANVTFATDATCLDILSGLVATELQCNSPLPSGRPVNDYCRLACGTCKDFITGADYEDLRAADMVLDVYVIPDFFTQTAGPGRFDATTSFVTAEGNLTAGIPYVLEINVLDGLGHPLPLMLAGDLNEALEVYGDDLTVSNVEFIGGSKYNPLL